MANISIVMVSYRTGPTLWLAIDAALAEPECGELILVNNGNSPGDTARLEALAQREPRIMLVEGQGNVGFGAGCNLGFKRAICEYILLLNPDCMLSPGVLGNALEAMQQWPEQTLAGCYLSNPDGTEQRGSRRELMTPGNAFVEALGLYHLFARLRRLNQHEIKIKDGVQEVPVISGAFMLMKRSFYTQLGGMDESYFLHMEDMDFCYRIHQMRGKVIYLPQVKVLHFRSTSEVTSAAIERYKAAGFIRYLKKHYASRYSAFALKLMTTGIWIRCYIKIALSRLDKLFIPPLQAKREIARLVLIHRLTRFDTTDDSLAGKHAIVTGASSQVGLSIIGKLLARGAQVTALYNETNIPFSHPRLEWVWCDLSKKDAPLKDMKADLLVHGAALWLLPEFLPALFDNGLRRVIAFSSTSVLAKMNSKNKYEREMVHKQAMAEQTLLRMGADRMRDVTIIRPTLIYGVAIDANVTRLADAMKRFGFVPVYGGALGLRQPVQALDLAESVITIVDNPKTYGKMYCLGGKEALPYREMLKRIFYFIGKKPRIIAIPFFAWLLDMLGMLYQLGNLNGEMARRMNQNLVFDTQPAIDDFGYAPKGFLEGDVVL